MAIDLLNSLGGPATDLLINSGFDIGVLRPYVGRDGRSYITRTIDGKPRVIVSNTPATLSYDAYKLFDGVILKTLLARQKLVGDIRAAGLTYNIPNGMAHTMIQYATQSDITRATISMDPVRRSEADRPTTDIGLLPLPVIHKDFDYSAREILVSRQGNMPLDTSTAELAAEKVAEEIERLCIGEGVGYSYGGGTVYGLINFPYRTTKNDLTAPTGSNNTSVIADILTMRQSLINNKHFGPYRLYVNSQWPQFMDTDFSTLKGDQTLRQRILSIQDIQDVQVLDFLPTTNYHMVMVEMDTKNIRVVVGMEAQTVQWESAGGMMKHFKVMAMVIPQLRSDVSGYSGIAHGKSATP